MMKFEYYSDEKILENCYIAVRVDGRAFHTEVDKMDLKRPFDRKLRTAICLSAKEVMGGILKAYVSDFIKVFLESLVGKRGLIWSF